MFTRILFTIALFMGSSAHAASEATVSGTTAGETSTARTNVPDDFYINVFSIFHGPGVTNLDKPFTPDANGKTLSTNAMNFDSELTVAYMLTKTIGVGPVVPFYLYPVLGKGFSLGDVGVKVFNKKFYSTSNLNVYANLIFQLPTSDYSKASYRSQDFAIKMTPNVRYSIPQSRFTVGAWTEQKAYLGVISGKTTKLYAAPYVSYQQSPKFSWNLEFEAEADHFYGKPTWDLTMYQTDLMPGFVYMIAPTVMVNPYLQVFTSQKVSMQNTALGAIISASL